MSSEARQRQQNRPWRRRIFTPSGSSSSEEESQTILTPSSTQQSTSRLDTSREEKEEKGSSGISNPSGKHSSGSRTITAPTTITVAERDNGLSILDILRMLGGLVILSCALSWFITDGESLMWNMRPKWARWEVLKTIFTPEMVLSDAQLSKYDGSDPTLPIYVGLNGSIFDVSSSRHTYGPGGGYHVFAGVDAVRGFVTGCFAEDRTHDLRGVEEMYLEDDEELDLYEVGRYPHYKKLSMVQRRELDKRAKERRKKAWKKVEDTVKHWDGFYRHHEKYFYVGKVIHRDLSGEPVRKLCEAAQRQKPPKQVRPQGEN